jgi:hypothetical protein
MGWPMNSRLKRIDLGSQSGAGLTAASLYWDVPKTGILAALELNITGNLTTAPSTPTAVGMAAAVNRVRLIANSGINLIDVSGVGYHYLFRDYIDDYSDPVADSDAKDAVASGAYNVSMIFPIAINSRDEVGLIMLQNNDTQLRLEVTKGAATDIANDFTVMTFDVRPIIYVHTVPVDPKDWPAFEYAHTITEEQTTVSGAGSVTWNWPRGNLYAQVIHGLGVGTTGSDDWTDAALRVNQSDYLMPPLPPVHFTREFYKTHGRARELGHIGLFDGLGDSGLGCYGSARDLLDSRVLTDIQSVITAGAAGTLYTIKRQLVPLPK